jgi:hypothetical protein
MVATYRGSCGGQNGFCKLPNLQAAKRKGRHDCGQQVPLRGPIFFDSLKPGACRQKLVVRDLFVVSICQRRFVNRWHEVM